MGVATGSAAILAGALALTLTTLSLRLVMRTFMVQAHQAQLASDFHPLMLTLIVAAGLAIGGVLMLLPKAPGWWVAFGSALAGLFDLVRLFRNLFGSINMEHPRADETLATLSVYAGIPAVLYVAVLALLCLHPVRAAFRVGSARIEAIEEGQ